MNFSVLLSVYFRERPDFLQQSLESICTQTLKPSEVIIIKDGVLTDELEHVIEYYSQQFLVFKIIALPQNMGLGIALNEGLKHCSFDLVARMDTDDIAKPDRFEKQMAIFENMPDVDVCSSWIDEFLEDTDHTVSVKMLPETQSEIFSYAKKRCPVNHPAVMFKKSIVLAAGGYKHFPLFEDYYLWVRILVNGGKFYNIQESLLNFRISKGMFKRRGGIRYALNEFCFQWFLYKLSFISFHEFITNEFVRFFFRLMPNSLRSFFYKKTLRERFNK